MPLSQIVYVSRRTESLTLPELAQIVASSAKNNSRKAITGVLMCLGEHILQLLEGDDAAIEVLFEHISKDPRHDSVQKLLSKTIAKRMFPEWGMALADFEPKNQLNRSRLLALIEDIRAHCNTAHYNVEARVLLTDFKQQLSEAA